MDNGVLRANYMAGSSAYVGDIANGLTAMYVADGGWHHVAFTVDATGGRLYVDGVLRDSKPWSGAAGGPSTTQEMSLGR